MTCPRCRLINPPSAARCDCGYDFASGVMAASYLSPAQRAADRPRRALDGRRIAAAFCSAAAVTLLVLSLARLNGPRGTIGGATYLCMAGATGLIVVGVLLLPWRTTRADAAPVAAAGLGTWTALLLGLRLLL